MTIEELGQESVKHGEQLKTLFGKVDALTSKMDSIENLTLSVQKLAISVEQLAQNQAEDRQEQKRIANEIIEIKNVPLKNKANWSDKILDKALTVIVGAVVGYLLSKLLGI